MELSAATLSNLKENGITRVYPQGDVIINEQSYIRSIPIVLSGIIKIIRTDEEGGELLLYYVKPGESCIMSFLSGMRGTPCALKAVAEDNVEILLVPIERSTALIRENTEWLDYIFQLYHKRFEELLDIVNSVTFQRKDKRILNFLREKQKLTNANDITITHQQLADELGTSRVVVSRLLKQMEADGLVRLGRNKISLL